MAKGFPGMGNMGGMMKQVQKMQKQMAELQAQLEEKEIEASAGGGAVVAVANGKKQIVSITIDKEVVDPDDVDMLQDLVLAAVNEALRNAEEYVSNEMGKITGGMNIPGLF
ncbi:YbaB/EbfC family nucleoid-associated protein [Anaerosalibacter sp. Marseille-P3206]|uniref:YbaB/EbfC family nucleoid-associated protein n=1 Tax=Anaerosalibacter sp. Marseille-P3206 TaxID=1871005 RepID=UPI000986A5F1|nr:YbaB/EbfC family nucleoid-associated protein [Anaerosalibacter sp. Marseille-P3206]